MLYAKNSIQEMKKEDIVNKLSSNPLYEQVFNRIKDSVRSGEYKKGDLIPSEKELMELMGVSRVTVRQALKMLSDSGIIETRKGKGSIVAVDWKSILDPGELRDQAETYWHLFEQSTLARRVIEPSIAKQAAIMATEQDIRQLEYAFEHDSEIDEQAEPSIRIRKGTGLQSFHGCLWEILRNPLMKQIWEATVPPSNAITALPLIVPVRQESYKAEMRKQHGNILKAVKDHDPEYAFFYMLQHCDWIYETYQHYFEEFCR